MAAEIPSKLVSAGITEVGPINLNSLLEAIKSVDVKTYSEYPADNTGLRFGMRNSQGLVEYWAPSVPQTPADVKAVWLLHEFMEASKKYDQDYEYSTGMWWLLNLNPQQREQFRKNVLTIQLAGGVTGTGGGGDPWAIATKMMLLKISETYCKYRCAKGVSIYQFYREVLKLPLETNYDTSVTQIVSGKTHSGRPVIFVPVAYGVAVAFAPRPPDEVLRAFIPFMDELAKGNEWK
jgi:hypothetical protein